MSQPNVLFLFADDQRFDTLGALGNPCIHTPHLDKLAKRGTVFTHAHIPGGTKPAVCMPSRAMLHTGRSLFHLEKEGAEIPADHAVLGETLRDAGYETFGTGKWHNGTSAYARSFSAGDEIFFGGMEDHWNVPACRFDPQGIYPGRVHKVHDIWKTNNTSTLIADHIHAGVHSTDLFCRASCDFLQRRNRKNPFFLYCSLMAPHDPRTMPREFLELYDPEQIPLPENFQPVHDIDTGALDVRDEKLAASPRDPAEIRRHLAEYYAMITHLDHGLGRLVETLRQQGDWENTIIVFSGDNGLALGQHGLMGKQNLYDHSVRVPLLLAGPGIPKGASRSALVYLLDIFPTLCELLGLQQPPSVEGRSFARCLEDASAAPRDDLYLAYCQSIRGITTGRFKLIEYACGATQLFNLDQDPGESRNLANDPSESARVSTLRSRLWTLAREWEDEHHPLGKAFWSARPDLCRPVNGARR